MGEALTEAVNALRDLRDGKTWKFLCECTRPDCQEVVLLSRAEYEAFRERRDLVLAPGHHESRSARARRASRASIDDAHALRAQAAHQLRRALKIAEAARPPHD